MAGGQKVGINPFEVCLVLDKIRPFITLRWFLYHPSPSLCSKWLAQATKKETITPQLMFHPLRIA